MYKKAIIYMIISALAFTFLNVFVKRLIHINVYEVVFFRSIGTLFFTIPLLLKQNISFKGNSKKLLILRGLVGVTAMTLFFKSLQYLPTGTAVSIRYTSPILAAIFALFFLKERIKNIQWLFFAIAFSGVLLIKGFDAKLSTTGLLLVACSAIFTGLVYIVIRKIGDTEHPLVIVNYFMIISALIGGVFSISNWQNPQGIEWLILLSLGVFGFFGQYYMTKALQGTETNYIAPFKYIEVIFTMLIGVIWLSETYTAIGIIGIVLILTGLLLNTKVSAKK